MTPGALFAELVRRDRVLAAGGALMALGLIAAAVVAPFDSRQVMGINPWIKPMKFLMSIAIFLWTMAWFMPETDPRRSRRVAWIRWTMLLTMIGEIALIAMQAGRGTTSHFNDRSWFDARIFDLMGAMITVNTIAAAAFIGVLRPQVPADRAGYLRGVRLGLAVFVAGSLIGFVMVAHRGHAVPLPDGGAGLPFVNWSTTAGDIRMAHFVGLHALQLLPFAGYLLDTRTARPAAARRRTVTWMAVAWVAIVAAALGQALSGRPFIAL